MYENRQMNSAWKPVNLSTYASIKGLLKFRYRFDKVRQSESPLNLSEFFEYKDTFDENVICTYIWLDDIIDKCKFNIGQTNILEMYMSGYSEGDISLYSEYTQQHIHQTLNRICRRIYKVNYLSWYYDYIYLNKLKSDFTFKKCGVCKEILPVTNDFFDVDNNNKDGFRNTCKECRKGKND